MRKRRRAREFIGRDGLVAHEDRAGSVGRPKRIWRATPKVVFSRTLDSAGWDTTILREVSAPEIRALCAQPGGDMALGGAELAREFLAQDLVDDMRLYVHPVLVGRGKPLFTSPGPTRSLTLVGSRTFGNGVVLLRYARG